MEHAKEIELIELVAKRLNPARQEALRAHIEDCPACRRKLEGLARTWDILGAWEVRPAGRIRVTGREDPSVRQGRERARVMLRFPGAGTAVRIAAALAVTVLVGYTGGRWSVRPTAATLGTPPYLSVLSLEVGASLSPLVLQDGPSAGQEGQS